ncbi:hypothetical protein PMAYCL1PPCAC_11508, partial [Pristionchus mayeri]
PNSHFSRQMDVPIKFHEHLKLTNLGIGQSTINFINVTMQSDRYIVCNDKSGKSAQVVIFDMADPQKPMKRPSDTDSVIMHPRKKIAALRFGRKLQIFDLEKKSLVKEHLNEEDVSFWKWIDEETIGVVTPSSVHHWPLAGMTGPVKIFDRHPTVIGCQIINYRADSERKWLVLIGISAKSTHVAGSMQLYSMERRVSQPIEGSAACFIKFKMDGNPQPSNLLVFAVKNESGGKLIIVEVGVPPAGNRAYQRKGMDVPYSELAADYPIAMQASSRHGVVFLVTKQGFLHIFDVDSGASLYSNSISAESIFITAQYLQGGLIAINRKGQVLSVSLGEQKMIDYVRKTTPSLAGNLARRWEPFISQRYIPVSSTSFKDDGSVKVGDLLSITMPSPPPSSSLLDPPSSLLTIGFAPTPKATASDDEFRIDMASSNARFVAERFPAPPSPPSLPFTSPTSLFSKEDSIKTANYDDIHQLDLDVRSQSERVSLAPISSLSSLSVTRSARSSVYDIRGEDTTSYEGAVNYDNIQLDSDPGAGISSRFKPPPSLAFASSPDPFTVRKEDLPTYTGASYDTIYIDSSEKEGRSPSSLQLSRDSPASVQSRNQDTPIFGGSPSERHNDEPNDRAARAEKELDAIKARLRKCEALNSDLTERVERAEKEKDDIAHKYYQLKKKCREAMCILASEDDAPTSPSEKNNNGVSSPKENKSNGNSRAGQAELYPIERTDYS